MTEKDKKPCPICGREVAHMSSHFLNYHANAVKKIEEMSEKESMSEKKDEIVSNLKPSSDVKFKNSKEILNEYLDMMCQIAIMRSMSGLGNPNDSAIISAMNPQPQADPTETAFDMLDFAERLQQLSNSQIEEQSEPTGNLWLDVANAILPKVKELIDGYVGAKNENVQPKFDYGSQTTIGTVGTEPTTATIESDNSETKTGSDPEDTAKE